LYFTSKAQSVNTSYLCLANGDIVLADFSNCSTTVVASYFTGLYDISQGDTDDTLYGIIENNLYLVNINTGFVNPLGSLTAIGFNGSLEINSLVKESTGILLGVNTDSPGELFRINVANMTATYLGNVGYGSAGDLTFFEGELYLSANQNRLIRVDINTPSNSVLVGTISGANGFSSVFGVVTIITQNPCSTNPTYGLIATGGNDTAILDETNAQSTLNCTNITSSSIYGASEVASDIICSISLELEEDVTQNTAPTYCDVAVTQLNAIPDPINPLGSYSYLWTEQGSSVPLGNNASLPININSTTTYVCLITDSGRVAPDNVATATITVTINQPPTQPTLECWETATLNTITCSWEVSGTQPTAPTNLECWEMANFNTTSCSWEISGTQPTQPSIECWETTTFNTTTCSWVTIGTQPAQPNIECWETAVFNNITCNWEITGIQPNAPTNLECWETTSFNNTTCTWDIIGTQPTQPTIECWETATFNTTTCSWEVSGTQPTAPTNLECWEIATFNNTLCAWEVNGTQPTQPSIECWETATFNTTICSWEVSGTQPTAPINLECWEIATFNNTLCSWEINGTQSIQPSIECWETTVFNSITCNWEASGTQPTAPTNIDCWETAAFNTTTCSWEVSGTQPTAPTNLECWQVATFNNTSCTWEITGIQPIDTRNVSIVLCEGETLTLDANSNIQNPTYQWNTNQQSATIAIENPGIYTVQATDGCYVEITNFTVTLYENPIIANIVSYNSSIIVSLENQSEYQYSLDGVVYQNSPVFTNIPNGVYTVYVRSYLCNFIITQEHLHFYIPQFFTPNGDGVNDYFAINDLEYYNNTQVIIFNRYGKLLFSAKNRSVKWDGTLKGKKLPSSDYWYLITIDGKEFKGHFTLKR